MTNAIETKAFETLSYLSKEIPAYRGKLDSFAYSMDRIDQYVAEGLRSHVRALALLVAGESDDFVTRCSLALAWICECDDYAKAEISRWFLPAVRRIRNVKILRAHPRAAKLGDLINRYESAKPMSKPQAELVKKLIQESKDATSRAA